MDDEVKKHLLTLIPEKVRLLMERHEARAQKTEVFFESMQGVFTGDFEKDPEATLEHYLNLSDEECAWEKGDFRTQDLLLDNFIGRELARELKHELDAMRDVEDYKTKASLEELTRENEELRKERDAILERLSNAQKKYDALEGEVKRLRDSLSNKEAGEHEEAGGELEDRLLRAEQRLMEGEEYSNKLELYAKGLEKRLQECLQKREPLKLSRMAKLMGLALEVGRFTPSYAAEELDMKLYMVQDYLAELVEAGMLEKLRRGYYKAGVELESDGLEVEIAQRLASRGGDKK